MKVNDQLYINEKKDFHQRLKKLKTQHHNKLVSQKNNLLEIKKHHKLEITNEKALQEERQFSVRDNTNAELKEFITQHQNKLDKYHKSLTDTKKIMDEAKVRYTSNSKKQTLQKQIENEDVITHAADEAKKIAEDTAYNGQQQLKKITDDFNNEKNRMLMQQNLEHINNAGNSSTDIGQTTRDFIAKKNFANREYNKHIKFLEKTQKQHLTNVNRKHHVIRQQQVNTHKMELQNLREKYKKILLNTNDRYKTKILQLSNGNEEVIANIKNKFTKQLTGLKEQQTTTKEYYTNRENDPFYSILDIKPEIVDHGNEYLISIKIPEHEKEGILLTPQERKIRISFSRRFEERIESKKGFNKSARSESGLQEFTVKDILNPQKISREYENGILKFKVAKK